MSSQPLKRRALVFTLYNRPNYTHKVLESWRSVRGLENWHILFSIEPSPLLSQIITEVDKFIASTVLEDVEVSVNPKKLGVLHHPWHVFDTLFQAGYETVVRTEDDLLVSDDILELMSWMDEEFEHDSRVATFHGLTYSPDGSSPENVHITPNFNPLVWGTWKHRWEEFIRDTWDHDYSTFNGSKGNEAGWDWNLNTRLLPGRGLFCAAPELSRVQNIGEFGTHSTPANFSQAPTFHPTYNVDGYRLGR